MDAIFHKARQAVESARLPMLVAHRSPDGDTLGAMLAFGAHLDDVGKPHYRYCIDAPAPAYRFMPGIERVGNDPTIIRQNPPDLICTFDAGDINMTRLENLLAALPVRPTIVNFDHHATNTLFGDVNVVITDASSTAEVVYRYLSSVEAAIGPAAATCVLTGLCTDTGNFSNPATTAAAMRLGADLIRRGAKFSAVVRYLYKNKTPGVLKLWGVALERLHYDPVTETATTALFVRDFEECGVSDEAAEGISNFLAATLKVPVIEVLRETADGKVRGSLRTVLNRDIAALAMARGGGGHKKAAGFSVTGKIAQVDGNWKIV